MQAFKIASILIEGESFYQVISDLIKLLAEQIGVKRVSVYRIFSEKGEKHCEIITGIPEEEHGIGFKDRLELHPDINEALSRRFLLIKDAKNSALTNHFKAIVLEKNIGQILYVVFDLNHLGKCVIVVDACDNKVFSEKDIDFCKEIAKIVSLLMKRDARVREKTIKEEIDKLAHILRNALVVLHAKIKKIQRQMNDDFNIALESIKRFEKEFKEIEKQLQLKNKHN